MLASAGKASQRFWGGEVDDRRSSSSHWLGCSGKVFVMWDVVLGEGGAVGDVVTALMKTQVADSSTQPAERPTRINVAPGLIQTPC